MNAADFVARLDGVRQTGPGRWLARCPAHQDRNPSLSVREMDDGTVLLHDFAGCDAGAIVSAVGCELSDLFPARPRSHDYKPTRRGPHPADALAALTHEVIVALVSARMLAAGETLTADDLERLSLAVRRITSAQAVARA